jgi:Rps23 Pro-64 3,4-dihydroxylase Tpa1-like proline 4-hydroxylase
MLSKDFYMNFKTIVKNYQVSEPFNNIVIDNFLKEDVYQELQKEVDKLCISPSENWRFYKNAYGGIDEHENQIGKRQIDGTQNMLPTMQKVIKFFNSNFFLSLIKEISGIKDLETIKDYSNSGYHQTGKNGFLEIHHDFNLSHHDSGLFRQINFLFYLNSDWEENWGGHLELWDPEVKNCFSKILPIGNRVVMFNIDNAPHGHPHPLQCPQGVFRKSFALYYYNRTEPKYNLTKRALWKQELTSNL